MDYIAGRQPILEALQAGVSLQKIYLADNLKEKPGELVRSLAQKKGIPVEITSRSRLEKIVSPRVNHQGMVAILDSIPAYDPPDLLKIARQRQEPPFILMLDHLQDPFNLGNLIRTAAGVGMHGIVIPKRRAAGLTPAAVKGAAGALFRVSVARVSNLARTLDYFQQEGLWAVGAEANAGEPFYRLDYNIPLVMVLGGEDKGLSRLLKEKCDFLTHIPMTGKLNSFNVAVAGALVIYEAYRQRKGQVD